MITLPSFIIGFVLGSLVSGAVLAPPAYRWYDRGHKVDGYFLFELDEDDE